jgi:phosphoserine phosphatase
VAAASQAILLCLGESDPTQAVERAGAVLAEAGLRLGPSRVVASRRLRVVEHALSGAAPIDCRSATKRLRGLQGEFGVDLAVLPADAARRDKKLLVIDMDSTLVQSEGIDELAKEAGVGEAVAAITRRAMNGELDFVGALRERVGLLRGLPVHALERVAARTVLSPGAEVLIDVLRKGGCAVAVVSGGFDYFTTRLHARLGLSYSFANRLDVEDGRLTGRLVGEIVDGRRKAALLEEMARKEAVGLDRVLAIGDGANDLPMLERAGLGVAYNAKPAVREAAPVTLSVADLSAVLFFLGYAEAELPA